MNPWLALAALFILVGALGWSLFAIYSTVVPALPKIRRALQGRGGLGE